MLEPIFEADLQPEQYAYRAERSALDAVQAVHGLLNQGYTEVVDADLNGYFDTISHAELMQCVARRVSDKAAAGGSSARQRFVIPRGTVLVPRYSLRPYRLHLIKLWLDAPVEETDRRGHVHRTTRNQDEGQRTPQGAPLSPLLANLYLRRCILGCLCCIEKTALGHEQRLQSRIVN